MEIALASDIIVASEKAQFGLPEVKVGLIAAAGGIVRLSRQIPENLAMEMLLTGRAVTATEGRSFGFVNYVVSQSWWLQQKNWPMRSLRVRLHRFV